MNDETSKKRGGACRGQGRKPAKDGEITTPVAIRLTPSQKAKLHQLGGGKWVRARIDRAKAPNPGEAE